MAEISLSCLRTAYFDLTGPVIPAIANHHTDVDRLASLGQAKG